MFGGFRSRALCVSRLVAFELKPIRSRVFESFTSAARFFIFFILKHGKFRLFLPDPEETRIWEGENESVCSRQHLPFAASARYFTNRVDASVTV